MEALILLRDANVFPSDEVLKDALGEGVYRVIESFLGTVTGEGYGLNMEWRYYNDGKAWLGKLTLKKKTILWLSVWDGHFKTSFYFTEKHLEAIAALDISETIKENFSMAKTIGKLIPMVFVINNHESLIDLLKVIRFKMSLK